MEAGAAGIHDLLRRKHPHPMTDATIIDTADQTLPWDRECWGGAEADVGQPPPVFF